MWVPLYILFFSISCFKNATFRLVLALLTSFCLITYSSVISATVMVATIIFASVVYVSLMSVSLMSASVILNLCLCSVFVCNVGCVSNVCHYNDYFFYVCLCPKLWIEKTNDLVDIETEISRNLKGLIAIEIATTVRKKSLAAIATAIWFFETQPRRERELDR
jgi:hypothetical protein